MYSFRGTLKMQPWLSSPCLCHLPAVWPSARHNLSEPISPSLPPRGCCCQCLSSSKLALSFSISCLLNSLYSNPAWNQWAASPVRNLIHTWEGCKLVSLSRCLPFTGGKGPGLGGRGQRWRTREEGSQISPRQSSVSRAAIETERREILPQWNKHLGRVVGCTPDWRDGQECPCWYVARCKIEGARHSLGGGEGVLASKSDTPQFQSWLHHLLAVWLWGSHLTSLSLRFFNCKMELITSTLLDYMLIKRSANNI